MSQLDELVEVCKSTTDVKIAAYNKHGQRFYATVVSINSLDRTVVVKNIHWTGRTPRKPTKNTFTAVDLGLVKTRSGRSRHYVIICDNRGLK